MINNINKKTVSLFVLVVFFIILLGISIVIKNNNFTKTYVIKKSNLISDKEKDIIIESTSAKVKLGEVRFDSNTVSKSSSAKSSSNLSENYNYKLIESMTAH